MARGGPTGAVLHNAIVRRAVGAFAAVTVGEWVLGTTVAIHAYAVGGALLVGLVGFRFVPAALAGLATAQLADIHRRERVLTATALTRAGASGLAALSLALHLPFAVPLVLVWIDAMAGSSFRPAQAALLPMVVRTPSELTAAAAAASNAKCSSQFVGALAGGLLVAHAPVALAVTVATLLYLVAALATAGIRVLARPGAASEGLGLRRRLHRIAEAARALRGDREASEIVAYSGLRALLRGLWISLGVIAALGLLGLGRAGFGILMAAAAAGAFAGIPLSALLVGRRRLAPWLAAGLLLCGAPLAAIGAIAEGVPAVALMVLWGIGMAISDVAAQALLNRVIPAASIGSVTGFMESGKLLLEGAGALLAPVLVATLGIQDALIAVGCVAVALVLLGGPVFAGIDARAVGRVAVLEMLGAVPFFHWLRVDALEGVVAQLRRRAVRAGQVVMAQGDRSDGHWYLVEGGELDVLMGDFVVNELGPGAGFGERALMLDAPRAATVRARTDVRLLSLERADFLAAVAWPDLPADGLDPFDPSAADRVDVLGHTPLLQGVGGRVLEGLAEAAVESHVEAGTTIIAEGALDDRYYVLLAGSAVVTVGGEERRVLVPGDDFGEVAVLHRVPRQATVTATEASTVLSVPGEHVRVAARERGGRLRKLVES